MSASFVCSHQTCCYLLNACLALALLLLQLGKTPWVAAWDRLLRVVLRLELRCGSLSRDSSALQEAFKAAAVSEQRVAAAAAPAAAKAGSRGNSSSGAAGSQAAKDAAAAAGEGAEGGTAEVGELCITAPELEEVSGCRLCMVQQSVWQRMLCLHSLLPSAQAYLCIRCLVCKHICACCSMPCSDVGRAER